MGKNTLINNSNFSVTWAHSLLRDIAKWLVIHLVTQQALIEISYVPGPGLILQIQWRPKQFKHCHDRAYIIGEGE